MPEQMTNEQAAEYIGVKPQTLAVWRTTGRYDLKFYKIGSSVRYRRTDLDAWMNKRCGTSTATAVTA
jgi:excisionase family DNA binding protein